MTAGGVPRRLFAVVALVLIAVTTASAALFVFRHLLVIIAVDLVTILAIWAVWEAVTTRGAARIIAGVLAGFSVAVVATLLIVSGSVIGFVVIVALILLSGAAAREALHRGVDEPGSAPVGAVPDRSVLFMNPASGGGKVGRFGLVEQARERGAKVVEIGQGRDLRAMATAAAHGGADLLGAAGGDGTQAIVAQVAADNDLAFLCIPAGTRNHFALDLGLDRDDPSAALGGLDASADERAVDLASVSGRPFVNNVSMGVYAKVVQSDAYRENKIGTFAEMLPDLVGPDAEPFDLHFETASGQVDGAELVMVSNNPYRFTNLTDFGTRDRIDTGMLGVVVAQVDSASDAAEVVRLSAIGQVERYKGWNAFASPSFTVSAECGQIPAGVDGEAMMLESPAEFVTQPGALRVRLPSDRPGVRAPRPSLGFNTALRLWRLAISGT